MTTVLAPALTPTMYFVGVSTQQSSIMSVFPRWAAHLGLDAVLRGVDLAPGSADADYVEVVEHIKRDPMSVGALVTTHKLDLLRAARPLFDALDADAELLDEVSAIAKRDGRLLGSAKDPQTSGLALRAVLGDRYWRDHRADLLLLGAGGASVALTLYLHRRAAAGAGAPRRLIVTDVEAERLDGMRATHERFELALPIEYVAVGGAPDNDEQLRALAPRSLVVNASGLGKDRPGSPLTGEVAFPDGAVAWDLNYRGTRQFLTEAQARSTSDPVRLVDGWDYFVYGWTSAIAEVFDVEIPATGPRFQELSSIASATESGAQP